MTASGSAPEFGTYELPGEALFTATPEQWLEATALVRALRRTLPDRDRGANPDQ